MKVKEKKKILRKEDVKVEKVLMKMEIRKERQILQCQRAAAEVL